MNLQEKKKINKILQDMDQQNNRSIYDLMEIEDEGFQGLQGPQKGSYVEQLIENQVDFQAIQQQNSQSSKSINHNISASVPGLLSILQNTQKSNSYLSSYTLSGHNNSKILQSLTQSYDSHDLTNKSELTFSIKKIAKSQPKVNNSGNQDVRQSFIFMSDGHSINQNRQRSLIQRNQQQIQDLYNSDKNKLKLSDCYNKKQSLINISTSKNENILDDIGLYQQFKQRQDIIPDDIYDQDQLQGQKLRQRQQEIQYEIQRLRQIRINYINLGKQYASLSQKNDNDFGKKQRKLLKKQQQQLDEIIKQIDQKLIISQTKSIPDQVLPQISILQIYYDDKLKFLRQLYKKDKKVIKTFKQRSQNSRMFSSFLRQYYNQNKQQYCIDFEGDNILVQQQKKMSQFLSLYWNNTNQFNHSHTNFGNKQWNMFINNIDNFPVLEQIWLNHNKITQIHQQQFLVLVLKNYNHQIHDIFLHHNDLNQKTLLNLIKWRLSHKLVSFRIYADYRKILSLNFANTKISISYFNSYYRILSQNTGQQEDGDPDDRWQMVQMNFSSNNLINKQFQQFVQTIVSFPSLRRVDLSNNKIEIIKIKSLRKLKQNKIQNIGERCMLIINLKENKLSKKSKQNLKQMRNQLYQCGIFIQYDGQLTLKQYSYLKQNLSLTFSYCFFEQLYIDDIKKQQSLNSLIVYFIIQVKKCQILSKNDLIQLIKKQLLQIPNSKYGNIFFQLWIKEEIILFIDFIYMNQIKSNQNQTMMGQNRNYQNYQLKFFTIYKIINNLQFEIFQDDIDQCRSIFQKVKIVLSQFPNLTKEQILFLIDYIFVRCQKSTKCYHNDSQKIIQKLYQIMFILLKLPFLNIHNQEQKMRQQMNLKVQQPLFIIDNDKTTLNNSIFLQKTYQFILKNQLEQLISIFGSGNQAISLKTPQNQLSTLKLMNRLGRNIQRKKQIKLVIKDKDIKRYKQINDKHFYEEQKIKFHNLLQQLITIMQQKISRNIEQRRQYQRDFQKNELINQRKQQHDEYFNSKLCNELINLINQNQIKQTIIQIYTVRQ